MGSTNHFDITLPKELAEQIERKVASGAYASVSELVREGIELLLDRDTPLERWLREDVVRSYDAFEADPSRGIPIDEVMPRLRERRGKRQEVAQAK
jgi:putative addiction module CopG family antidote